MTLRTALYAAKGEGAVMMAIPNPECYDDGDDEWDVEPTNDINIILDWMGQTDDLPNIVFFDENNIVLGQWVILWDDPNDDWLADCDCGNWTELVTEGHY